MKKKEIYERAEEAARDGRRSRFVSDKRVGSSLNGSDVVVTVADPRYYEKRGNGYIGFKERYAEESAMAKAYERLKNKLVVDNYRLAWVGDRQKKYPNATPFMFESFLGMYNLNMQEDK